MTLVVILKYVLLLPLAVIGGPEISLLSGFLIRMGFFALVPAYFCLMAGDLISDVGWYLVGFYGGRKIILKYGRFFGLNEKNLGVVERIYHRHFTWILLVSKLTMGFGFAVAIVAVAGIVKIPFRKYMTYNVIGQPFWTAMLVALGYYLGEFYTRVNRGLEILYFFAAIVILGALIFGIVGYVRSRIIERYS